MTRIVEANQGEITLPAEVASQHRRYLLEVQAEVLTLRPGQTFWKTATPEQTAAAFREWASQHQDGPGLPHEALRRENLYS